MHTVLYGHSDLCYIGLQLKICRECSLFSKFYCTLCLKTTALMLHTITSAHTNPILLYV